MIKAIVISNGIQVLSRLYRSNEKVNYHFAEVNANFDPDLSGYDLLVVPNGTDHIAMMKIKEKVITFLNEGNTLFCFCGWFTSWIPNHQWIMDNSKKTIDIRYKVRDDRYGIFNELDITELNFSHGISGWWACGYIENDDKADVLIEDTWGRAMMVIDEVTTPGMMVLTASGPLADLGYNDHGKDKSDHIISKLYNKCIDIVSSKILVS
jgi:hypothetical protein